MIQSIFFDDAATIGDPGKQWDVSDDLNPITTPDWAREELQDSSFLPISMFSNLTSIVSVIKNILCVFPAQALLLIHV